jgi:RNA polymerase sigma-70 factor (ECF subfamily)
VERVLRLAPWERAADADRDPVDPAEQARHDARFDERLVLGLRGREPWAAAALVDRYGKHVRRVLFRVLGGDDADHADLAQEVLVQAWRGIGQLQQPSALKAWLTHMAVFSARGAIRRRRRRGWLAFRAELPDRPQAWATPDLQDAATAVYRVFDRMPEDERLPFALRMLEGMSLEEAAAACGMSLATVRRRMARAERRFFKLAREYEALIPWCRQADGSERGEAP